MKKTYLSIISIILVILILFPIISYAVNIPEKNEKSVFFTADKTEASLGDTVLLTFDLSKIDYENFKFELSSNSDLENISTSENVSTVIKNNKLTMSGSKKDLSVEKINFSYLITEEYKIGDEIKLTGKIINTDAEENSDEQKITIKVIEKKEENEKTNEDVNNNSTQKDNQQIEKNEKQDNSKEQEQNTKNAPQEKNLTQSGSQENSKMQGNTASSFNKTNNQTLANNLQTNTKSTAPQNTKSQINTKNAASKVETNTYKGESNNYLSKLKISGYDISPKFDKTNNTYFITIDKDVEKLDITAKAEANSAIVTVYGNTNLKSGTNKILINVTAENGDVKTYRIYVTK